MNKPRWADMTDDPPEDLEIPIVISKHGVKVKKPASNQAESPHKTNPTVEVKK